MNNNFEHLNKEIKETKESYRDAMIRRIMGVAALKTIINDTPGDNYLLKNVIEKTDQAFRMEQMYVDRLKELRDTLKKLKTTDQTGGQQ